MGGDLELESEAGAVERTYMSQSVEKTLVDTARGKTALLKL